LPRLGLRLGSFKNRQIGALEKVIVEKGVGVKPSNLHGARYSADAMRTVWRKAPEPSFRLLQSDLDKVTLDAI
jgi:hypothetical protein